MSPAMLRCWEISLRQVHRRKGAEGAEAGPVCGRKPPAIVQEGHMARRLLSYWMMLSASDSVWLGPRHPVVDDSASQADDSFPCLAIF